MANAPRSQKIQPRIEPIKGSVGAPAVPGNRDITEQPGQNDDGRRSDQTTVARARLSPARSVARRLRGHIRARDTDPARSGRQTPIGGTSCHGRAD